MRKFLVTLIAVAALGSGAALAQGYWAGASTGYPFGVTLHFGIEDLLSPGVDLRVNLRGDLIRGSSTGVTYSGFAVGVGADVLYSLSDMVTDSPVLPYVGGGLMLGFVSGSATTTGSPPQTAGIGGISYDIHGLVGAEYPINPTWGVFGEGQLGYGAAAAAAADQFGNIVSASTSGLTFALRLGVNYHF